MSPWDLGGDAEVVYGVIAKEIEPLKAAIAYFKEHIDNY